MRYRHYKGGIYELVCEATLEADLTPMIVYRAADGSIWTRPKDVFFQLTKSTASWSSVSLPSTDGRLRACPGLFHA